MKTDIDKLFNNSQTHKDLQLKPELWDRLEQKLDQQSQPSFQFRKYLFAIAASIMLAVTSLILLRQGNDYTLEDLNVQSHSTLNTETISQLHNFPAIYYNTGFLKG